LVQLTISGGLPTDGSFTLAFLALEILVGIITSMCLIRATFSLVEDEKITHRSFNLNRKKQESILVYDEIEG
jgi:hypothetical protein